MSRSKVLEVKLLNSTLDYRLYAFIMFTSKKIRFHNSYLSLNFNFVWLSKWHNILHILFFISFQAIFHFSRCHTRKFLRNREDGRTYWPVYWICQQHQSNKSNQRSAQKSKQIPDLMMIHHYNNTVSQGQQLHQRINDMLVMTSWWSGSDFWLWTVMVYHS